MDNQNLESTNRLLRVVVALLLRRFELSQKQQIEALSDLGLRPSEIAEILGKPGTYINKELTGIRKSRSKR